MATETSSSQACVRLQRLPETFTETFLATPALAAEPHMRVMSRSRSARRSGRKVPPRRIIRILRSRVRLALCQGDLRPLVLSWIPGAPLRLRIGCGARGRATRSAARQPRRSRPRSCRFAAMPLIPVDHSAFKWPSAGSSSWPPVLGFACPPTRLRRMDRPVLKCNSFVPVRSRWNS